MIRFALPALLILAACGADGPPEAGGRVPYGAPAVETQPRIGGGTLSVSGSMRTGVRL
ncbi:hypothetical protein [Pseudoroseicyclus aestuarii]|uniref:Uncharacterized protein n=1 Tax=Pseudoroseicyclus aestuarii TaxID=1795041 RepID=A0A318SSJ3_9RHOB|nr:hypothetical protein [Pseudoroseicyclus aestuarii]PYE84673.1 hypothetical protein DFP88_102476 [Pseudoroseicyclus aestuarii]